MKGPGAGEEVSPTPTADPAQRAVFQLSPTHNREEDYGS
jgi:hypothetical protein